MLAADTLSTAARPWKFTAADEYCDGQYAEFLAWMRWMLRHLDGPLADTGSDGVLDALDVTQQAYLFNLMGRLADGTAPRDEEAR